MLNFRGKHLWLVPVMSMTVLCAQSAPEADQSSGRKLNPYHEQQLQEQIRKCASGIMACSDDELRSVKQQELCQLLIRSERHEEALRVAHNIYMTDNADGERRAAHHFLVARIYNMMMNASTTVDDMEKYRQSALAAAQEVLAKNYPSKWQVSAYARTLVQELSDQKVIARVKQRALERQDSKADSAKEAIADAQRRYLDATQGSRGTRAGEPSMQAPSKFTRVAAQKKDPDKVVAVNEPAPGVLTERLPSQPTVSRVLTPLNSGVVTEAVVGDRLQETGLLTSQPGISSVTSSRPPILINGKTGDGMTAEEIARHNMNQLLEAKRKRLETQRLASPYASGENPVNVRQ